MMRVTEIKRATVNSCAALPPRGKDSKPAAGAGGWGSRRSGQGCVPSAKQKRGAHVLYLHNRSWDEHEPLEAEARFIDFDIAYAPEFV
jgi:hypothetical protein